LEKATEPVVRKTTEKKMPFVLFEICLYLRISLASELTHLLISFATHNNSTDCSTIVATYLTINFMRGSSLPPVLVYFPFKRGVEVTKFPTTVK
jgi:hypothetical protein